jgi:putative hydrolase of the HAD superfamily
MVRTVIFDLGGVYFTNGTKSAVEGIGKKFHIPHEKVNDVLNGELGLQYREGLLSERKFWQKAQEIFGTNVDLRILRDVWFGGYIPIQGTVDLITILNKNGYEILYLSDNVQERVDYLEDKYHFKQHFKEGIFSYLVKKVKPDVEVYELVLRCTNSQPSECVFIDDKEPFLAPARELGMQVVQFQNPLQIEKDLRSFGVVVDEQPQDIL